MGAVTHREMRNNSAEVLRRVESGEQLTVTNHGRPVARLVPIRADILGELEDRGELRPARCDWDDFPSPDPSDVTTDEILADLRREW